MAICPQCNREFPEELIEDVLLGYECLLICPLCALRIINELCGRPEGTPFSGKQAQHNVREALKIYPGG